MSKLILLDPGHGLNIKTMFARPLMAFENDKVIKVCGGRPHSMDNMPDFYREDHGNMYIALACREALEEVGYDVVMTREGISEAKENISRQMAMTKWQKKIWGNITCIKKYIKFVEPDAFVSIHTNAGPPNVNGVVGIYNALEAKDFAMAVAESVTKETQLHFRKLTRRKNLGVIKPILSHGKQCLIECGFHTNPHDLNLLILAEQRYKIGQAIAMGIHNYLIQE